MLSATFMMHVTSLSSNLHYVNSGFLDTTIEGKAGAVSVSDTEAVQQPKAAELVCILYMDMLTSLLKKKSVQTGDFSVSQVTQTAIIS